ncbi:MAG TPA: glycosyltransferase family 39 protein [Candidatus Bathyarchaeia archaeon]|nr:glycosyltransferase family 39 protein [Candidatus Bathyarchaeia archaeon]
MNQFTASLWGDEGWAATLAIKPYLEIIRTVARDTSPPLYYLCLHTWMKFFGTSEVAIRSLSFLFFLGTVVTVFFIAKHLWDKKTAILAALLTLTNPFLFTYAFEGRMYAILAFTSTLSIYFFLKKNRPGFILATTTALYSHHFSIFIILWEAIWRLGENWGQPFKKLVKSFSDFFVIGLLYLPWLYPLYYQTSLVGSGFWLGKPTFLDLIGVIKKFLIGTGETRLEFFALIAIVITLFLRRCWQEKKMTFFLTGWFLAPLIFTFLISQAFQPIFYDRYMLMAIPAGSLLIASLRRKPSIIFIFLAIFLLGIINYGYFFQPTKRPFRQLADFVKTEASDLVLINYNAGSHHLWESKYYGLEAPIYAPTPLPFYTGTALMQTEDIISTLPDEEKIGAISSAPPEEVQIAGFEIEKSQKFDRLWFLWLKRE